MEGVRALTWYPACEIADIEPHRGVSVKVGGERLAVFLVAGRPYAVRDMCPHQGALLSPGNTYQEADGTPVVVCPIHYWAFSLEDGACLYAPSMRAAVFAAEIRGDTVWVEVERANVGAVKESSTSDAD